MSIATVVTRGYGSFGSVNSLPTLGYAIGESAVPAPSHWHTIEGPSEQLYVVAGPSEELYILKGCD